MKLFNTLFVALLLTTRPVAAQTISTIAGTYRGDGQTALSIGILPTSTATDAAGNLYFAEPDRHIVRKLSVAGIYSTVAGTGIVGFSGDGGPANQARLDDPQRIILDSVGNLYISDTHGCRVRKVTPGGIISTIAGNGILGFSGDGGPAIQAQFQYPFSLALDKTGNLYIADQENFRVRKVASNGIITTFAGGGSNQFDDGVPAIQASLRPTGLAFNTAGDLFVSDGSSGNIRKISPAGIISLYAGPRYGGGFTFSGDGGPATAATFALPYSLATDVAGNLYVADYFNNRVRKISSSGIITTVAGNGVQGFSGDGGNATAAQLYWPINVQSDAAGNLFVVVKNRIRKVNTGNSISTVGGNGQLGYNGNNLPISGSQIYQAFGVAVNKQQEIYWSERDNHIIRKLSAGGIVSTVAGVLGQAGYNGDGGAANSAFLKYPESIAFDTADNLYIVDGSNFRIRKVLVNGTITTVAGTGQYGFSGDGGPAINAQVSATSGIAADKNGNVYFTDRSNQRIRKIASNGIITTIAGNGTAGFSGDGGSATVAALNYPEKIAIDTVGNILIVDAANYRVRKVDVGTGLITTVAGNGIEGTGADSVQATATPITPYSVRTDSMNNLLILATNALRRVNSTGIISTIAGGVGTYADGVVPAASSLNFISDFTINKYGDIYLADVSDIRIRKITFSNCGNWTGAIDSNWENTGNWTCGRLPDFTTDVVIHTGTIRVNSNVVVHSLRLDPSVSLIVGAGYTLTVLQ